MERNREHALRRLTLIVDGVLLVAAIFAASLLHSVARRFFPFVLEVAAPDQLVALPFIILPLFLFLLAAFGLHRIHEQPWTTGEIVWRLVKVHFVVFVVLVTLLFVTKTVLNRSLAGLFLACSFAFLSFERLLIRRWRAFRGARHGNRQVLLVGAPGALLSEFVSKTSATDSGAVIVGVLSPRASADEPLPAKLERRGAPDELSVVLQQDAVDEVYFFPPFHRPGDVVALLDVCETVGVPAAFAVELPRPTSAKPRVVFAADAPFISFELAPKNAEALAVKQLFDITVAAGVLVVAAPVLLLAALLILATMGRPVFFVQERAGLFGRKFRMFKLRTMSRDAEDSREQLSAHNELTGPVFKMTADPRITPVGRLLRKTSIDELPQLFHVLSGAMSLVGPRPLPTAEQRQIQGWHRRRLSMKPGITGLWQVSGRSDLSFEEWMKLDLEYVDEWSLSLDFKILLRTLPAVLSGRGAR